MNESERRRWTVVALAASGLAAVASTWPLATAIGRAIPTNQWHCLGVGCEDEFLCVWIVGTLAKRLLHAPLALFEGGILLPLRHTLAYSETMLTAVALTAPVTWLTGNALLGYDLYYLSTIALSVLGTYLVVRDATDDPRAALVAGLAFGLAGDRWMVRGHLAKVSVQWVPFVCWTWMRYLDRPGRARGLALAAAVLANLHSSVYQGLLLPMLLVPWAGVLAASRRWDVRRWIASGAIVGGALAVGLVLYWPFAVVRDELSFVTSGEVLIDWSWYVGPLLHPLAYLSRLATSSRAVDAMSPLPFAAALLALAVARRPSLTAAPAAERTHLLAAIAFTMTGIALTVHTEQLGPLGTAIHAVFLLPGLDGLRGRSRLAIVVVFGAAVVLGICLAMACRRLRRPTARLVVAASLVAVCVDTRTFHERSPLTWLPSADQLPPAVALAARTDPTGGLLHLPCGRWSDETLDMMWALHHDRPLMNGYTAVMPRFLGILGTFPGRPALQALADAGVTDVLVHTDRMPPAALERIRMAPDLERTQLDDILLVHLGHGPDPRPPLSGRPLPRDGWRLEGSDPGADAAVDGDLATHWITRTIGRPTFLRVDLGAPQVVTGIRLRLGPHLREYPHAWEVWGSPDGVAWEQLGGERPTQPPFTSYRRDHRAIELDLPMRQTSVRALEIRVPLQNDFVHFVGHGTGTWGIHELAILGR